METYHRFKKLFIKGEEESSIEVECGKCNSRKVVKVSNNELHFPKITKEEQIFYTSKVHLLMPFSLECDLCTKLRMMSDCVTVVIIGSNEGILKHIEERRQ